MEVDIPMFTRAGKRPRSAFVGTRKRPTDKKLVVVTLDNIAATQVQTVLVTATFPCTIVGLRWNLTFTQSAGTGATRTGWGIVVVRDGNTATAISFTDGADFYTPEQDMLTFGTNTIDNNTETGHTEGSTKSMRKLMGGDQLIFIALNVATQTVNLFGVVQFFCKT